MPRSYPKRRYGRKVPNRRGYIQRYYNKPWNRPRSNRNYKYHAGPRPTSRSLLTKPDTTARGFTSARSYFTSPSYADLYNQYIQQKRFEQIAAQRRAQQGTTNPFQINTGKK